MNKIKIGDLLLNSGAISKEQLQQALDLQIKKNDKLGKTLIELGFIDENSFAKILSEQLDIPFIDLNKFNINYNITKKIPEKISRRFKLLALDYQNNNYIIGMVEPNNVLAYDEITKILGNNISTGIIKESSFLNIIDRVYRRTEDIASFAKELKEELGKENITFNNSEENIMGDESSPVARLMDSIFEDAVQIGSSDIHIEPENNLVRIRQRVDGLLQENIIEGRQIADSLLLRIKLLAKLNISEKRLPQDGRFMVKVKGKNLDIRAATMPVRYGETAVLRLLDQSSGILKLDELINCRETLSRVRYQINRPNGLILLTGPTGSGKTTTLYAMLNELNVEEKKIISIEDPIEYSLPRVSQIQVNVSIGLTFAKILRTVLRQDPEIIMIGEMRDEETAQIGLRAAMTGHLVLATLHTNDAISSPIRLIDMGAAGYTVAAALRTVISQRLIRKICKKCSDDITITDQEKIVLKDLVGYFDPKWQFKKGSGCSECGKTGYKGRLAIQEFLEINPELSSALRQGNSDLFAQAALKQKSFKPLVINMLNAALEGYTSLEEIFRTAVENTVTTNDIPMNKQDLTTKIKDDPQG